METTTADRYMDVFPVKMAPVKSDANNKGDVLWFSPSHGWYKGWFRLQHWPGTSHWARIPDEPPTPGPVDVVAERDAAFKRWLDQFPTQLDPTAVALLRSGFDGGYTYRGQS